MYLIKEASKKLTIKASTPKIEKFIEKCIKEYKLSAEKGDYSYKNGIFIVFNTNQYNFTDIRADANRSKIEYDEV